MLQRSICLMLLVCCVFSGFAQPSWEMIHAGRWIESIGFFTPERGIAAGRGGALRLTTDGGLTWSIIQDQGWGLELSFPRVVIVSPTVAYIISWYDGLLKTTDAGETWELKPHNLVGEIIAASFVDEMTGWVTGLTGSLVFKTTDGGGTWTTTSLPVGIGFRGMHFIDSLRGWVCGHAGEILRTTDGGSTWQPLNSGTTATLYAIRFISPTTGFAAGDNKTVLKTTNGGTSWSPISIQTTTADMRGIDFFGNNGTIIGYGPVGATSVKLVTTNGGTSWTEVTDTTVSPFTVAYASANVVCQAGIGALSRSTNGGMTWQKVLDLPEYGFRRLRFLSSSIGYGIGVDGSSYFMLKSADAGATWERQTDPAVASGVWDMWWISPTTGVAVGASGKIVRTADGGSTWITLTSPTTQRLEAVAFTTSGTGYAAGLQGTILKTTNSGGTWTQLSSGITTRLRVLAVAPTFSTVWAAGDSGRVLKSTDAGATWVPQSSGTTQPIVTLYFRDSQRGWLLTNAGALRYTTNGGETWQSRSLPGNARTGDIKGITFVDNNTGWVTGARHHPCYTTDGGTTWYAQRTPGSLYGSGNVVYFLNANRGWIAGSEATMFRTDNGGVTPVSIQVTSPNGGEILSGGTQHIITWATTNTGSGHVRITLRRATGFAEELGTAAGYLGQFAWSVPDTTMDSLNIRVADLLHSSVWDESDGYFSISPAVSVHESEVPMQFSLSQNYPNPFNPATKIEYSIPTESFVTLKVYNIMGQEVAALVNEKQAASKYVAAFDGRTLASGVYFYKLTAGDFVSTRKLMLLK